MLADAADNPGAGYGDSVVLLRALELSLGPRALLRVGSTFVVVVTVDMQVFDRSISWRLRMILPRNAFSS